MILDLFFLLVGLIIYFKKKEWVLLYWLFISIFCLAPCAIFNHIMTVDDLNTLNYKLAVISRNYFAILIVIELFRGKRFPKLSQIYLSIGLLFVYLFLWSLSTHFSFHVIWSAISELLSLLLILIYIVLNKNALPSYQDIIKFFKATLIIETVVVILNVFNIYIFPSQYQSLMMENFMGELVEVDVSKITGTFYRYNGLANFLTTIFLFISIEYFSKNYIKFSQYLTLCIIFIIPIALSGAKISLVIYFFIFLICGIFYFKKHSTITTIAIFSSIIVFIFLKNFNPAQLDINNTGIERQLIGLSNFINDMDSDESSTVGLSNYLLSNYFDKKPLIGNGYSYKGDFAYGSIGSMVSLRNFTSDARVAFILVEYGIIGFLLYTNFFYKIFSYLRKKTSIQFRRNLTICFIYYAILTITESGFFDRLCFPLIFIYFVYCQQTEILPNYIKAKTKNSKFHILRNKNNISSYKNK